MKRFKSKKIKKNNKFIKFIFMFFLFFSYIFVVNYLQEHKLKSNILKEDNNYINYNIINSIDKVVTKKINNPVSLLNYKVSSTSNKKSKKETKTVMKIKQNSNDVEELLPVVYLYNTHQTEKYDGYSVYDATNYLSSLLTSSNIGTYFETSSVPVFLSDNNLKYYKSYTASKTFLKQARAKMPSLKYFFDIHRDSISKERVTVSYNKKNYANVLFLVGTDNSNYNVNLNNANNLSNIINSLLPNLSHGIMQKGGAGVDGVYNQDCDGNVFLIEIGSLQSSKEEVNNTMDILNKAILRYIKETI